MLVFIFNCKKRIQSDGQNKHKKMRTQNNISLTKELIYMLFCMYIIYMQKQVKWSSQKSVSMEVFTGEWHCFLLIY
jgi:hypothetical protein